MKISKKKNIFLICAFCFILLIPLFDNIFHFSPIKELFEKRLPASLPSLPQNLDEAKNFSKNFENFFNDNYGFRKTLIFLNSKIMDNVFNESPSSRALIGKDEWLFFDNQKSLLDAQGLAKIDENKLQFAAKIFVQNWHKAQKNNINYLLVIAPDKTTIYPEFLPDFIKYSNKDHRIDKFIVALKTEDKNFPLLDLRPVLLEAKKQEIIYHKTDTHWNRRGAHFGYVEIMKKFYQPFHSRADFVDVEGEIKGDISDIMNTDAKNIDYSLEEKYEKNFSQQDPTKAELAQFHKPVFYKNHNKNFPILFVYKDSFFDNMMEFFSADFSQTYFVNQFPCNLDFSVFQKYHPDFVIQEFWEGRIEEVIANCR